MCYIWYSVKYKVCCYVDITGCHSNYSASPGHQFSSSKSGKPETAGYVPGSFGNKITSQKLKHIKYWHKTHIEHTKGENLQFVDKIYCKFSHKTNNNMNTSTFNTYKQRKHF